MAAVVNQSSTPKQILVANTGVGLNNSTFTTVLEVLIPPEVRKLGVQIAPTVQALTAFVVAAKFSPSGAYQTISSGVTATPAAPITAANATLATLAAASIGWLIMETSGLYAVQITAKCATDATGLIDVFATGAV